MPTVFASVSATIILFFLATMGLAYGHLLPVNLHILWGFFVATLIVLLSVPYFWIFSSEAANPLSGWSRKTT